MASVFSLSAYSTYSARWPVAIKSFISSLYYAYIIIFFGNLKLWVDGMRMLWNFNHTRFSHSSFFNNWECFSTISGTTSQFIRQQGIEAQFFLMLPPVLLLTICGWGRTKDTKRPINLSVQKNIFYKLKESLIQFWRPKFSQYTLLCKSTSVMPELTTQSMERSKSLAKQNGVLLSTVPGWDQTNDTKSPI